MKSTVNKITSVTEYLDRIKLLGDNFLRPHFCKDDSSKELRLNKLICYYLQEALYDISDNYCAIGDSAMVEEEDVQEFLLEPLPLDIEDTLVSSYINEDMGENKEEVTYKHIHYNVKDNIKYTKLKVFALSHPTMGLLNSCSIQKTFAPNPYAEDQYLVELDSEFTKEEILECRAYWVGNPVSICTRNTYIPEDILSATVPYVLDKLFNNVIRATGASSQPKQPNTNSFKQDYVEIVQRFMLTKPQLYPLMEKIIPESQRNMGIC